MEKRLFDYEGRLFYIIDGMRGYVWKTGEGWAVIDKDFAAKVWASGVAPDSPMKPNYGHDGTTDLPE